MLSFWRSVLCCDDEQNTREPNSEIYHDRSSSQSSKYHVITNSYGTFSRNIFSLPSTQTALRIQSRDYPNSFKFPQNPKIPSVYNQPKQILPRINVNVFSGLNQEKTADIPTATNTNVGLKSTSSSSYLLLPNTPSPRLGSSFSSSASFPVGASSGSLKSTSVFTKPILACGSTLTLNQTRSGYNVVEKSSTPSDVIPEYIKGLIRKDIIPGVLQKPLSPQAYKDYLATLLYAEGSHLEARHHSRNPGSSTITEACKSSEQQADVSAVLQISSTKDKLSEHSQQSTSKRKQKRKIKLVSDQKLKIAEAESCSLCKTLQKGNGYPQISSKPPIILPTKDVNIDFDGIPGQSTVPAKRSLAGYLHESGPRLVSLYGSTELYPTDEARCIIQGMVRAILNLKKDGKNHNYLRHPENLILGDNVCHPYSNYVRDLATEHVIRNRKILEQAGQDFASSTEVTLEKNRMDVKSDDLAALKYLIFAVILVLEDDKKPLLPAEWRSFKKLFSNTELDYAVLSSHPCLWGYKKRLGFYFALDKWCNPFKSEKMVIDLVVDNLRSMHIFRTNWVKRIKKDSHLLTFTRRMTRHRQRKVYGLIRFFRNLVEHCPDKAPASSPYRKERYLDYMLRKMYPNLLEELHQRLLLAGFNY